MAIVPKDIPWSERASENERHRLFPEVEQRRRLYVASGILFAGASQFLHCVYNIALHFFFGCQFQMLYLNEDCKISQKLILQHPFFFFVRYLIEFDYGQSDRGKENHVVTCWIRSDVPFTVTRWNRPADQCTFGKSMEACWILPMVRYGIFCYERLSTFATNIL